MLLVNKCGNVNYVTCFFLLIYNCPRFFEGSKKGCSMRSCKLFAHFEMKMDGIQPMGGAQLYYNLEGYDMYSTEITDPPADSLKACVPRSSLNDSFSFLV